MDRKRFRKTYKNGVMSVQWLFDDGSRRHWLIEQDGADGYEAQALLTYPPKYERRRKTFIVRTEEESGFEVCLYSNKWRYLLGAVSEEEALANAIAILFECQPPNLSEWSGLEPEEGAGTVPATETCPLCGGHP